MSAEQPTPAEVRPKRSKLDIPGLRARWDELRTLADLQTRHVAIGASGLLSGSSHPSATNIEATTRAVKVVNAVDYARNPAAHLEPITKEMLEIEEVYERMTRPALRLRELSKKQWLADGDPDDLRRLELQRRKILDYYVRNFDAYQWIRSVEPDLVDPYAFRGALDPDETLKLFVTDRFLDEDRTAELALSGDVDAMVAYGRTRPRFHTERRLEILGYDYHHLEREIGEELEAGEARKRAQSERVRDREDRNAYDQHDGPTTPVEMSGDLAHTKRGLKTTFIARARDHHQVIGRLLGDPPPDRDAIAAEVDGNPDVVIAANLAESVGTRNLGEVAKLLDGDHIHGFPKPSSKVRVQKVRRDT